MRTLLFAFSSLLVLAHAAQADSYIITFDASVREEPATGRVMLFFITETGRQWNRRQPMDAPFFESPQPITSVAVENWSPGEPIVIDDSSFVFPKPLSELHGTVRVQAVLDLYDNPERSHTDGPGNLYSDVVRLQVSSDRVDAHELTLANVIPARELPAPMPNLRWVELRSEMLSEFYDRDVYHRAGVALPLSYNHEPLAEKQWPAIYVIPGYGGRFTMAQHYAARFMSAGGHEEIWPHAVTIVLDAESPLGHHGFVDSPNHGPVGTALVEELIPYLESEFRLAQQAEARIVTGHSSGGWTSLWLILNWPNVFGACFSSAPDPIDFAAFQLTNLYEDDNVYIMPDGQPTPSYRRPISKTEDRVAMTVREECQMEYAMHPLGGSGQQWDAWMAMFSPKDSESGYPTRLFDPLTGEIDRAVVEHWKQFDMTRMVRSDWERFGPIITQRVRLACGMRDNYYLQRAVERLKAVVDEMQGDEDDGPGYIFLHESATHGDISWYMMRRWNTEMREHLRQHGLHR
jgi:hypothetical protein